MYIPKTLHEENVHNNYLMGLIFSTSWRVAPKKKIPHGDLDFLNFVCKSIGSSVSKNLANFYPGLVLHVLHWSHPGLVSHVLCQSLHPREPISSRQRPPPPACRRPKPQGWLWKVKWSDWVKWWKKWSVFGHLFFLKLIYIIDHVYT